MSGIKVEFYRTASGRLPVADYVGSLHSKEQKRVYAVLNDIENSGFETVGAHFRQISGKLWEIKINANRIFYVLITRNLMMLLHGYKKKSQKLPIRERDIAIKRMKEVLP